MQSRRNRSDFTILFGILSPLSTAVAYPPLVHPLRQVLSVLFGDGHSDADEMCKTFAVACAKQRRSRPIAFHSTSRLESGHCSKVFSLGMHRLFSIEYFPSCRQIFNIYEGSGKNAFHYQIHKETHPKSVAAEQPL